MCIICSELIKQKMTFKEAENAALELTVISPLSLNKKELEHAIDLLESLQDQDLERLDKTIKEGSNNGSL